MKSCDVHQKTSARSAEGTRRESSHGTGGRYLPLCKVAARSPRVALYKVHPPPESAGSTMSGRRKVVQGSLFLTLPQGRQGGIRLCKVRSSPTLPQGRQGGIRLCKVRSSPTLPQGRQGGMRLCKVHSSPTLPEIDAPSNNGQ